MGADLIRYDLLVQEALRGVVRKVLAAAARDGLPGDHYFHVEFLTAAPGVRLSDRMRERFPDRMTIILQHHFWDLEVTEEALEVGLSFGGVGERVRVPFVAVTGFFDESVQFGLRFEVDEKRAEEAPEAAATPAKPATIAAVPAAVKPAARDTDGESKDVKLGAKAESKPDATSGAGGEASGEASGEGGREANGEGGGEGAKVLSLNAFRKKT